MYANKFDNPDETYNFLEIYSPPKLYQDEIDQLNRPVTRNEIEYVIKTLPKKNVQDQMASQVNSTKYIKRNLYPSFLKFSKMLKKKEHSQIHFMQPPKKKLKANIFDEFRHKNSQQNLASQIQEHIKKDYTP